MNPLFLLFIFWFTKFVHQWWYSLWIAIGITAGVGLKGLAAFVSLATTPTRQVLHLWACYCPSFWHHPTQNMRSGLHLNMKPDSTVCGIPSSVLRKKWISVTLCCGRKTKCTVPSQPRYMMREFSNPKVYTAFLGWEERSNLASRFNGMYEFHNSWLDAN